MTTQDYSTIFLRAQQLDDTCVLVGQSGGLSAVYEVSPAAPMPDGQGGLAPAMRVLTEHGVMYMLASTSMQVVFD